MDVKKNFTSSVDIEKNELISFGGTETQKITRNNNPPVMRAKGHWNGTLRLDKLQDAAGRQNHRCAGLTASRKLPAYVWKL
jgi:hypothetical protein